MSSSNSILTLTLIQSPLEWENIHSNLSNFEQKLKRIGQATDIIVLPEMFTTGFSMSAPTLAETMDGSTMNWLKTQAAQYDAVITGSFIVKENGKYYNRLIWMQPDGHFESYDKRHLFTLAKEQETYTSGTQKLLVNYKGWKICPLVCYDLRFPVWSRNVEQYDLLIYVANWPDRRRDAWKTLLKARAIENQVYTIGVNRVGKDEKDLNYSGDSSLFDYQGELIYQVANRPDIFTTTLSKAPQDNFRNKLNFLADQDSFHIDL